MADRDRGELVEQLDQVDLLQGAPPHVGDHDRDLIAVGLEVDARVGDAAEIE